MSEKHWRLISASVPGTSHIKRQQPCQDAHYWQLISDQMIAVAVADGAGSAALADIGAQTAVKTAVQTLKDKLETLPEDDLQWQNLFKDVLKITYQTLEAEAVARQTSIRELASTLILVVATPNSVIATQVGDGAAVLCDQHDNIFALTTPQSGEHINETSFLISPDIIDPAPVMIWKGHLTRLALFSDGLQLLALKMPQGIPHPPFFHPLFQFIAEVTDEIEAKEQLVSFLQSPRVTERADDDLTLVLVAWQ